MDVDRKKMEALLIINRTVGWLFLICYSYQIFYIMVTLFKGKRPHIFSKLKLHRFAVLVSARNEETVIGALIDSIKNQDYPPQLIKIFIVADNCTDNTAEISRKAGAVIYERFDKTHIGKGYALDFLLERISEDFPCDAFDAFLFFDADNVLAENYITEINKTYCDGFLALTSYRNSKNYGDNWISAGYSLWFLREAKYLNNSRMILGASCAISGTGFMIDRSLIEDENGQKRWNYFLLTEDIEFTASNIVRGNCIGYCNSAEFYDEQPVKFTQSWNQRLRWAKGYLQVFANYGCELFSGIFGHKKSENASDKKRYNRFSCFDMTMTIMPAMILSGILFVVDLTGAVAMTLLGEWHNAGILVTLPIINTGIWIFAVGLITTVSEWKKIHTIASKKILYTLTFPFFILTYIPIALTALFSKNVEWKPTKHSKALSFADIHNNNIN